MILGISPKMSYANLRVGAVEYPVGYPDISGLIYHVVVTPDPLRAGTIMHIKGRAREEKSILQGLLVLILRLCLVHAI